MNPALTKMEGRDPEGGSQRCHLLVTCLFIHSTLCSWATPYQPGGEVEGEHVAPPRSHGLGEAVLKLIMTAEAEATMELVQGHRGAWGMVYQGGLPGGGNI